MKTKNIEYRGKRYIVFDREDGTYDVEVRIPGWIGVMRERGAHWRRVKPGGPTYRAVIEKAKEKK